LEPYVFIGCNNTTTIELLVPLKKNGLYHLE
jgi:hypothetical protein